MKITIFILILITLLLLCLLIIPITWYPVIVILIFTIVILLIYHTVSPTIDDIITFNLNKGERIGYNELREKYSISNDEQPIYIVYHIGPVGRWKQIVKEQMDVIISSGLYNIVDEILYGYDISQQSDVEEFMSSHQKCKLLPGGKTNHEFENGTINAAIEYLSGREGYLLYIHSKGVTAKNNTQNIWREYMMYWNVRKYETCIDILKRGFNTVGVCLLNFGMYKPHYSGNFWWSRIDYFTSREKISSVMDRFQAEWFILKNHEKGKHVCLWNKAYIDCHIHGYEIGDISDGENNNILII